MLGWDFFVDGMSEKNCPTTGSNKKQIILFRWKQMVETDLTASNLGLDFPAHWCCSQYVDASAIYGQTSSLGFEGMELNTCLCLCPFLLIPKSVDDSFKRSRHVLNPCVGACCFNSWSIHNAFGEPLKRIYKKHAIDPTYQKHNLKTDSENKKQMNPNLFHSPIHICASNCQYS